MNVSLERKKICHQFYTRQDSQKQNNVRQKRKARRQLRRHVSDFLILKQEVNNHLLSLKHFKNFTQEILNLNLEILGPHCSRANFQELIIIDRC